MFRHYITSIDYKKLIEMQANSCKTSIQNGGTAKGRVLVDSKNIKRKKHNLYNGVKRHH